MFPKQDFFLSRTVVSSLFDCHSYQFKKKKNHSASTHVYIVYLNILIYNVPFIMDIIPYFWALILQSKMLRVILPALDCMPDRLWRLGYKRPWLPSWMYTLPISLLSSPTLRKAGCHLVRRPVERPVYWGTEAFCQEPTRCPPTTLRGGWEVDSWAPDDPTDDTNPADSLKATLPETLSQNHSAEPFPGSWSSEIVWNCKCLLF